MGTGKHLFISNYYYYSCNWFGALEYSVFLFSLVHGVSVHIQPSFVFFTGYSLSPRLNTSSSTLSSVIHRPDCFLFGLFLFFFFLSRHLSYPFFYDATTIWETRDLHYRECYGMVSTSRRLYFVQSATGGVGLLVYRQLDIIIFFLFFKSFLSCFGASFHPHRHGGFFFFFSLFL